MAVEAFLRRARGGIRRLRRRRFDDGGFQRIAERGLSTMRDSVGLNTYQPLYGLDERGNSDVRPVSDRWEAIRPRLPLSGSALDIGCMNGWFTFQMADHGLLSLGVDSSDRDVQTARLLAVHNDTVGASIMKLEVTPETATQLPRVDVVLCLSVFHHLVRIHSLDYAVATMQALTACARHQFFFETGQPDEQDQRWASSLSFMGDNPTAWTEEFVVSLGFDKVERIGSFAGFRSDVRRALVLGERT